MCPCGHLRAGLAFIHVRAKAGVDSSMHPQSSSLETAQRASGLRVPGQQDLQHGFFVLINVTYSLARPFLKTPPSQAWATSLPGTLAALGVQARPAPQVSALQNRCGFWDVDLMN